MYVFLFLALPSFIIWYALTHQKFEWKAFVPPALWGFFFALVLCAIQEFFMLPVISHSASALMTFLGILLKRYLIPCALLCALFFMLSKDTWEYKCAALAPLLGAFMAVFMPYHVITGENSAAFNLIALPLLDCSVSVLIPVLASSALSAFEDHKKSSAIISLLLIPGALIIPPLMETCFYFGRRPSVLIALSALIFAAGMAFCIIYKKRHERTPIFMTM